LALWIWDLQTKKKIFVMTKPQTLFDKLWNGHRIADCGDGAELIAIDRVCLHERTGAVALRSLQEAGHEILSPERVFAIMDHIVSFRAGRGDDESRSPGGDVFITQTRAMAQSAGINLIDTNDSRQGIVHVIAPELGIALPGVSLICPDSHTCSLGALGALAWGVGSSESEHAMATGCLRVTKPPQMRVTVRGVLGVGVTAKDLALHLIAQYGVDGGKRCAIEYAGSAVDALSIEERLTLCNLAVEFSAFTAVIAPDAKVQAYVEGKAYAPSADEIGSAEKEWDSLFSDAGASFDYEIEIDAKSVRPMVSWGTSPAQALPLGEKIPPGADQNSLEYMGLSSGQSVEGLKLSGAFIGSCTNGRLSDLRAAAVVLKGKRVADGLRAVCVPGSQSVRRQAEAEGLDKIFMQAGFEWGAPGCAMCFYAGGETFAPGERVISSTNRNFEGRQGPGVRTHLASPATVAASAILGMIACAETVDMEGMQ
jgi:3-isopropylmalate/(R)-2-methylmalate dehydratase large subunit